MGGFQVVFHVELEKVLQPLRRAGVVDDPQQQVVLPEAESQRHAERRERHDDPRAQLGQVLDKCEPVLVTDRAVFGHARGAR